MMTVSSKIWPWVVLGTSAAMAFSLSCRFAAAHAREDGAEPRLSEVERILGSSRLALSSYFFDMADVYFHKGVEHVETRAFEDGFFQTVSKAISPERVVHAAGQNVKEMMPWIRLATRTDPHNLDPYLVGAFLLSREIGRPDLAHELLREAQYDNPKSYEAPLEDARVYLKEKNVPAAKHALDVGLAFWPGGKDPQDADARQDKAALLLFRGLLHEVDGENVAAIANYQEILILFPERTALQTRIESLRGGGQPSVLATWLWRDTLIQQDRQGGTCQSPEHVEEDDKAP